MIETPTGLTIVRSSILKLSKSLVPLLGSARRVFESEFSLRFLTDPRGRMYNSSGTYDGPWPGIPCRAIVEIRGATFRDIEVEERPRLEWRSMEGPVGWIARGSQAVMDEKAGRAGPIGAGFANPLAWPLSRNEFGLSSEQDEGRGVEFLGTGSTAVTREPSRSLVRLYG